MRNLNFGMRFFAFIIVTFFIFGIITSVYINTDKELADVTDKLIRLHVVANSDSPEDQTLKLYVRDEVIRQMAAKFENLNDINEVKAVIRNNLTVIEQIAKQEIARRGRSYGVKATLGNYDFPTKAYGNLTLPAGNYQALNIVIGEGEGKNWWCVMFPPLCFIDIAHGVVPKETMKELKKTLSEEEYQILVSSKSSKDVPVKLRLKIFEIAKGIKVKKKVATIVK